MDIDKVLWGGWLSPGPGTLARGAASRQVANDSIEQARRRFAPRALRTELVDNFVENLPRMHPSAPPPKPPVAIGIHLRDKKIIKIKHIN
ncbi:hypothetical protein [Paraburkholderia humisilvae]|uniref:hypothetical protein n=1 Tax=Paraburkholderia humisilvae TaxID=627669 RepID=UPI001C2EFB39|nr:hypothetical protein [Paraburkholderia humisilvae]